MVDDKWQNPWDFFSCGACEKVCNGENDGESLAKEGFRRGSRGHRVQGVNSADGGQPCNRDSPLFNKEAGVGLLMEVKEFDYWGPCLMVKEVQRGGASWGSGIERGDILFSVAGVVVAGRKVGEMCSMLQGGEGSSVVLELEKVGTHVDHKVARRSNLRVVQVVRRSNGRSTSDGHTGQQVTLPASVENNPAMEMTNIRHKTETLPLWRSSSTKSTSSKDGMERRAGSPKGDGKEHVLMKCAFKYVPPPDKVQQNDTFIVALEQGEICKVLCTGSRGWSTVERWNDQVGWFPSAYLSELTE